MILTLKAFLIAVWLWMVYVVISTSLESGLFEQWEFLASIPWMRATLWDFYANILLIYLFVLYKERSLLIKLMWAILFFCLGSIASIAYVFVALSKVKSHQELKILFAPNPR